MAAAVGFLAGASAMALLVWRGPAWTGARESPLAAQTADGGRREVADRPSPLSTPSPVSTPASLSPTAEPAIGANPLADLRDRQLQMPLREVTREELRDSFDETRGSTRRHEAIDIMAPRNTPVLAVEDGTIARLFLSKAGGITVYQFDPTLTYVYYYAHLERYADGLREGDRVRAGQILGSVGTSGNAPKDTPHLHFAIFRLTDKKRWWEGSPIDPYEVLKIP
jgi:murein DD-endopeptidase MepM/ murein hydrolase activator NlpD